MTFDILYPGMIETMYLWRLPKHPVMCTVLTHGGHIKYCSRWLYGNNNSTDNWTLVEIWFEKMIIEYVIISFMNKV